MAAGKARGLAAGLIMADGTGVDMNALERGALGGALAPPPRHDLGLVSK